jgi:hypothetical protein
MVSKTMERHVLPTLVNSITIIAIFYLWMSRRGFDTFVLVMNYINKKWEPCYVVVGIFEVHETLKAAMAIQFKDLLVRYNLLDKIIAYVKDEGVNLNTFTMTLINIVSCFSLITTTLRY